MSRVIQNAFNKPIPAKDYIKEQIRNALQEGLSQEELTQLEIIQDVTKWAYVYFGWTAFDYQVPILKNIINDSQAVFRLGRRLGKTEMMCILILWYAFTQYNKKRVTNDTEDVYDILIVAPFEKQIDLIFKRLKELIEASPAYKNVLVRDVKHNLKLANGTNILGITAGSKTGNGANNTRGQRADLIVFDEVDQLGLTINSVKRGKRQVIIEVIPCEALKATLMCA